MLTIGFFSQTLRLLRSFPPNTAVVNLHITSLFWASQNFSRFLEFNWHAEPVAAVVAAVRLSILKHNALLASEMRRSSRFTPAGRLLRQWRLPRARLRVKGTCTRTAKDQPLPATAGAKSQPTVNKAETAFPVGSTHSPIIGLSLFSRTVSGHGRLGQWTAKNGYNNSVTT